MDFDANVIGAVLHAPCQLRRELGLIAQRQHLLDFHSYGHRPRRQPEGFTGGRQRYLAETCPGHDRLAVHLVVRQPGKEFGPNVGLPDVIASRRQLDVCAQQRMGAGRLPGRRKRRRPVSGMQPRCRREIDESVCAVSSLRCSN